MKKLAGWIGALLIPLSAPLAQGALQISYAITGGVAVAPTLCAGLNPGTDQSALCSTFTADGVTFTNLNGSSNSPGGGPPGPNNANSEGATVALINTTGATRTVDLWFVAQDFTSPTAPPSPSILFTSSIGGTVTGTGTIDLTSCADTSNLLAPPTNPFCGGGGSPSITNTTTSFTNAIGSSYNNSATSTVTTLGSGYSLGEHITVVLQGSTQVSLTATATLTPVPEPASIAFLGTCLFGLTALLRKKFKRS